MKIATEHEVSFAEGSDLAGVRDALCGARRMVIVSHQNADGDAVGSLTAMSRLMRRIAPSAVVTAMLPDGVPTDLDWLPGTDEVLCGQTDRSLCDKAIAEADIVLTLDLSQLVRTGCLESSLQSTHALRMAIDHHIAPDTEVYGIVVSDPGISSTCELVYWTIKALFGDIFDCESATSLYTGICTDTGTFSYSNTRQSIYIATAELLSYGIDPLKINRQIKNTFSIERLRFFGHAMADLTTIFPEQSVALMVIERDELARYGVESAELTGLVNEVMRLRDTDCAILVREEADRVRLSFRSKERYDVNQMAKELFDGGGHKRAAGATSHLSLSDTIERVKRHLMLAMLPLLALVAGACKQVPVVEVAQEGDNRRIEERLIEANRIIAGSEDKQIDEYLARRGWTTARLTGGTRVHINQHGSGDKIEYEDSVIATYSVEAIDGTTLYRETKDTIVAGHLKPTRGMDAALLTLCYGSRATVIVPSEQAYGVIGDGDRIGTRMVLVYQIDNIEKNEHK